MSYRDDIHEERRWTVQLQFEKRITAEIHTSPHVNTLNIKINGELGVGDLNRLISALQKIEKQANAYFKRKYG